MKRFVFLFLGACLLGFVAVSYAQIWAEATDAVPDPASVSTVAEQAVPTLDIQADLDADGYCKLPPGRHVIDKPIVIRQGRTLEGSGFATVIEVRKPHAYGVIFGDANQVAVAQYLRDLRLTGGGLYVRRMGNHSEIRRVWASWCRQDGVHVEATGELMLFSHIVAWGNQGDGIEVLARDCANTGIFLDHCTSSANQGAGLRLGSAGPRGVLARVTVDRTTIQGNGHGGEVDAEIIVEGRVSGMRFEHLWVENQQKRTPHLERGIRLSGRWEIEDGKPIFVRPGLFWIGGHSAIHLVPRMIRVEACHGFRVDWLTGPGDIEVTDLRWDADPARIDGEWLVTYPERVRFLPIDRPPMPPTGQPAPDGGPATEKP
jgi:hypothetical protein